MDELTWCVGDQELRLGAPTHLPTTRNGWVALLADVMTCSLDEAAQVYDDHFANEAFVRSVLTDIDRLGDGGSP
jgi:hypothetical protein